MDRDIVLDRVRSFVRERIPALPGTAVVIAASGGADSSAMVSLLCEADLIDRPRCVIGHFDHRLRSAAASRADLDAVRALADRYGLRIEHDSWEAPCPGEEAARIARYRFLRDVADENACAAVVTGHTADDQAETIVMRIARGSGLHGLRGIAPDAPWPLTTWAPSALPVTETGCGRSTSSSPSLPGKGPSLPGKVEDSPVRGSGVRSVRVWRPLLSIDRAATRAWCADHAIAYHDDASNDDRARLRNVVRLDVLPALERAQPGTRVALLRLAEESRPAVERLEQHAAAAIVARDGGVVLLDRETLSRMTADEAACAYRLAVGHVLGDARGFDRRHFESMRRAATSRAGVTLTLPRGITLTVERRQVVVSLGAPYAPVIDKATEEHLPFAGQLGTWRIDARAGGPLAFPREAVLRRRRPGDRLRPAGMHGTKKLQDELVDRGVPRRLRDAVPVVAVGTQVLWTPYGRCEPHPGAGDTYTIEAEFAAP